MVSTDARLGHVDTCMANRHYPTTTTLEQKIIHIEMDATTKKQNKKKETMVREFGVVRSQLIGARTYAAGVQASILSAPWHSFDS
mmetsp:Transcript_31766/g.59197  ORF Transcript_31766/g.59197 Transcript_31766/m.59197 type:complete len:85 (+) Transcript_31766:353-607(+)